MHNPVGLLAMRSSPSVENKGFSHANLLEGVSDALVPPCCLPKPSICRPICPRPCWVLPVLVAEKVPLILWCRSDPTSLCTYIHKHTKINELIREIYQIVLGKLNN